MSTNNILQKNYGFDKTLDLANIGYLNPENDLIQQLAEVFEMPQRFFEQYHWDYCMLSGGMRHFIRSTLYMDQKIARTILNNFQHEVYSQAMIATMHNLAMSWMNPCDGYTTEDFLKFATRLKDQLDHIMQQDVSEQQHMINNKTIVDTMLEKWGNWRLFAMLASEDGDHAILLPKTSSTYDFGSFASSGEELLERLQQNYKNFFNPRKKLFPKGRNILLETLVQPSKRLHTNDSRFRTSRKRKFGYFRAIEMNEFLHTGDDGQTFGDYLQKNTEYMQYIQNFDFRDHSALSTTIANYTADVPLFLDCASMDQLGVQAQKIVLGLTKEEYIELYTNPHKKSGLVRTDKKSLTLKYIKGFLAEFFAEETVLDTVESLPVEDATAKLFQVIMQADSHSVIQLSKNRNSSYTSNPAIALKKFLEDFWFVDVFKQGYYMPLIGFSILYGEEGEVFQDFSMLDMMFFAHAMKNPEHFAADNMEAESALNILMTAVLEDRLSARGAIQFIVLGMQDRKNVSVLQKDDVDIVASFMNNADDIPEEWIMASVKTKKRRIQLPEFVRYVLSAV